MDKSPDAFRTISEVADVLDTPAHVLRFWESRFPQIRPVKRAGGRRYYRPADVALLLGIKHLLHDEGMTIRGVQKVLREQGVRHVAGYSGQEVTDDTDSAEAALEAALAANFGPPDDGSDLAQDQIETAQIVALEDALKARALQAEAARLAEAAEELPPLAEASPEPDAEAEAEVPQPETAPVLAEAPLPNAPPSPGLIAELASLERIDEDILTERAAPLPDAPLLIRLRALPHGCLATAEARHLRDRLVALADRIAAPPPPSSI
ncbi:MAG: MerR family transcriptional regulator [Pseudorhodobacter sp.]|nr:MAG: MerR family transcriptional regulator [Pseudorhodobacter sp.]